MRHRGTVDYDHASTDLSSLRKVRSAGFSRVCKIVVHRRLAVVVTVSNVLQEQFDLLVGNDVADILRLIEAAEGEPII